MSLRDEILEMAAARAGVTPKGTEGGDLLGALRLSGGDATGFLEAVAARYGFDLTPMLWYFHYNADEPPLYRRVLPVDAAGMVYPMQPISVDLLVEAAETGRWPVQYPAHTQRLSRLRIVLPALFFSAITGAVLLLFLWV